MEAMLALSASRRAEIDATNLLCSAVMNRLPEGWQIRLTMTGEECWVEAIDPSGTVIDFGDPEYTISDMVEAALEGGGDE